MIGFSPLWEVRGLANLPAPVLAEAQNIYSVPWRIFSDSQLPYALNFYFLVKKVFYRLRYNPAPSHPITVQKIYHCVPLGVLKWLLMKFSWLGGSKKFLQGIKGIYLLLYRFLREWFLNIENNSIVYFCTWAKCLLLLYVNPIHLHLVFRFYFLIQSST